MDYLDILVRNSHPANQPALLLLVVLVGLAGLWLRGPAAALRDRTCALLVTGLVFEAVHWLAYPSEDRLLVGGHLVILIAAANAVADRPPPA